MPLYERDARDGGELTPARDVPEEVIRSIERCDENAIVQRLTTGTASKAFVYRFPIETRTGVKEVIGISTDGAYEIASMLGNIEVLDVKIDKDSDPDYFYALVRAKDLTRNVTLVGVGRQCKYVLGEGNKPNYDRPDEHAFTKAVSKAQRNVILHLTPESVITKIIKKFEESGRSTQIEPPKLEVEEAKPPEVTRSATPTKRNPDDVKPRDLPNGYALEKIAFECWGLQPKAMWAELNYDSVKNFEEARVETAWDCFLKLKALRQ